ncbi:MAG: succinate dehydrogenase [Acidobacteria bacterium]|nr:succinate dehydrogenase [Acidobacteriota bacterium]
MEVIPVRLESRGFGETERRDMWWSTPLVVLIGLSLFVVYATWAAFQNAHYTYGPYLSPFYAPEIFGDSPHAWFGPKPGWIPAWVPFSPALLILPFPGLFRFTCYYYRGAYYKAFWGDPPACAVGEPRNAYRGEQSFPLILQNVHRYFMWIAVGFLFLLSYDVWLAIWFTDPTTGATQLGVGLGTILLAVNVVLLSCYTLGCHVMRHIVGGVHDEVSKHPLCDRAYACSTALNYKHQLFAWGSLFSVAFADIYIRLCSMGIWTDPRVF